MRKILAVFLLVISVAIFISHEYLVHRVPDPSRPILWGVTFSKKFSKDLGLDWKANYNALLNDLGVRHLRLAAYWDETEPLQGKFDFTDLDYQINLAAAHHADVVLAIGAKAPRWPECYYPDWTASLDDAERRAALINYVKLTAEHYKNNPAIRYLQIENEPYLGFGNCAHKDVPAALKDEIAAVKKIDPSRQVLVTGSIFADTWLNSAKAGDLFGTSLYRRIYTDRFGYVDYPFPPSYFRIKSVLAHIVIRDPRKKFIVIEMQAEPWVKGGLASTTNKEQLARFDLPYFEDSVRYAKEAGFNEYYLWGGEWWYRMKEKQAHPEFWNYAKTLFAQSD